MERNFVKNNVWSRIPLITKNLVIINLLFWIASVLFPVITDYLGLHYFKSDKFNLVQLVTYMFMHGGFDHIFFNMFAVFMFGRVLEQVWGPKRFLIFYMVTGIGAGIIQEITWYIDIQPFIKAVDQYLITGNTGILGQYWNVSDLMGASAETIIRSRELLLDKMLTVGASGAVFGILLGFGMLFPNAPLYLLFIPVPIKAKYMVIAYGLLELFAGVADFSGDNVAHFAHLGGMVFGYFLIRYWRKKGIGNGFFLG